jgi:signal transduction histidine kinase/CheY-like chemotaxis protein/HPt (histidine-containing phosphotransfer) domain-containing protein
MNAVRAPEPLAAEELLDALPDAALVLDRAGRPLRANAAARALVGQSMSQRASFLEDAFADEPARAAMQHALGVSRDELRVETDLKSWRGESIAVEARLRPIARRGEGAESLLVLRDLRAQRAADEVSRAGQRRLAALVESLGAAVLVEDEQRRVVLANESFCRMFGIPAAPSALVGVDCAVAAGAASALFVDGERYLAGIRECIEAAAERQAERLRLADGRTFERDYVPVLAGGASAGHLWVYRDVSEQCDAEQALREAKEEAEAASAAKDSFCAILSHELRTPLGAVLGLAELLHSSELSADQRLAAEGITRAGRSLLSLIDELLDYGKIRAGKFVVQAVDADPRRAVREAIEVLAPQAEAKGLCLTLRIARAVPAWAWVDALRLRQIVTNLVSNAIKYTARGEIVVDARFEPSSRKLHLDVHDTGAGVPEWAEPLLFQPFSRIPDPSHARVTGSGLGLVITRQLVEVMGGSVGYLRREGSGSTFWFEVTLDESRSPPRPPSVTNFPVFRPRAGGVRERRGVVLLAEDEPLNRMVARRMIEELGFEVVVAEGGAAAIELAKTRRFDAVLMDLEMPLIDGLAATRAIRALEPPRTRLPIIAVTASAMPSDRERCLAAGMDDYLTKPITLADLAVMLDRHAGAGLVAPDRAAPLSPLSPGAQSASTTTCSTSTLAARSPTLDRARMAALAGPAGDPGLLEELIALFRTDASARVHDLESAAEGSRRDEVKRLAHALKGASATFGAVRLAQCASSLETAVEGEAIDAVRARVRELHGELAAMEEALRSPTRAEQAAR